MIKAPKKAMYGLLGSADINDEELQTAFVGAEGIVNYQPLTYQSCNPNDDTTLTPNHFLLGQCGGEMSPELPPSSHLRHRRRRVQELISHFWLRWMKEWLPLLNVCSKWYTRDRDLKVGDLVLAISIGQPCGHIGLLAELRKFSLEKMHTFVSRELK